MIISWFILLVLGLLSCIFKSSISENNGMFCALIIFIDSIVIVSQILHFNTTKQIKNYILGGFFFRMILFIWDLNCRNIFVLPNSGLDTESFAIWSKSGYLYGDYMRGGMYAKFIAFWYRFFGIQRPIAQFVNVLITITILYLALKLMCKLNINQKIQEQVVLLLCFLPNFAITNSILLRETLIIMLLSLSVYYFVIWIQENKLPCIAISIIFCCLAATVHSGAIAILLGEAIIYILYNRKENKIIFNQNSIFYIAVVLIGFIIINSQFGDVLFGKFQGVESAEDVISTADKYNSGSSSYDAGFAINNSIVSLIVNTPIRMLYFVASPLPWNWRGLSDIIAFFFSSLVFLYVYYRAYQELKKGHTKNRTMILIFVILSLCSALIFAWGVSNAGTAVRHREKFIIVYMILLALCNSNEKIEEVSSK